MGAENWVTSRDLQVLVDEPAEPVPSEHADVRSGMRRGAARGRALVQGSVRSVGVEVLDILAQNDVEVAWSGDQDVVEAFPAQGADEPLGDRVRPRRSDRGADDADLGTGEDGVKVMEILSGALLSAKLGREITVSELYSIEAMRSEPTPGWPIG